MAVLVALAAGLSVFAVWAREHRKAMAARGIAPTINPHVFGWVCLALSAMTVIWNYSTYRNGWVNAIPYRRVYRAERPKEFQLWAVFHGLIATVLLYLALNTLFR